MKLVLPFLSSLLLPFMVLGFILVTGVSGHPLTDTHAHEEEIEVHVQIMNRKRVRRHLPPLSKSSKADFEYHLKIDSVSVDTGRDPTSFSYNVKLQPVKGSVFGAGFRYTELGVDAEGNPTTKTVVPSREELDSIEASLYSDSRTKSVVKLERDNEDGVGNLDLHGVVNGARIRTRRDVSTGGKKYTIINYIREPPKMSSQDVKDYVLLPSNDTSFKPSRRAGIPAGKTPHFDTTPELALVLDYQLSKEIGGGKKTRLEYAAITVNGVNGFYELTNHEIGIKCELVHVYAIMARNQQSFINNNKVYSGSDSPTEYNVYPLLDGYQEWVFKNAEKLGAYDLAPLLASFKFEGDTAGIASAAGACFFDNNGGMSFAAPVATDRGANFEGILVLAHEIGHSMGSPHDGRPPEMSGKYQLPDTTPCIFEHGYLMGYNRIDVGTNPFKFSKCSVDAIKLFMETEQSKCLLSDQKTGRSNLIETTRHAGEPGGYVKAFDPKTHCKNMNLEGWAYQFPDKQCRLVTCRGNDGHVHSNSAVPARNTPCGDNARKGSCRNGYCIGQGPPPKDLTLDKLCTLTSGNSDSKFLKEKNEPDRTITQIPMSAACDGFSQWYCLSKNENGGPDDWFLENMQNVTALPGTPCSESGDKICFKGACVEEQSAIQDKDFECIIQTGKQEAKKDETFHHEDPKCTGITKCVYGSEFELIGEKSTDKDCNPEVARPTYETQNEPNDIPPVSVESDQGQGRQVKGGKSTAKILQELCIEKAGPEYRPVASTDGNGKGKRDKLCKEVVCHSTSGVPVTISSVPKGIMCGPLRRCNKKGKCVKCVPKKDE